VSSVFAVHPPKVFLVCLFAAKALHAGLTVEGRLPGESFREDNPPRFGATTSLVSESDSVVVLKVRKVAPSYTIARQLDAIVHAFKIARKSLKKLETIDGVQRWLQYRFTKGAGGGFVYITRQANWIVYLVVYNLHYEMLATDLPVIDRYIKQLKLSEDTR